MKLNNINKIFLVGDLHLGIRNNSVEWADIQKEFLLEVLPNTAAENGFNPETDILILEGDIFHSRESINVRIQNDSMEIFENLAKVFKRGVFIILGNHDVYYKDSNQVNSVRHLKHLAENIHVFESPEVLTINGTENWLMLPWVEDTKTLGNHVADYAQMCKRIVCHADIKGLKFNRWTKVEHGLEVTALSQYDRVYSGHIHHRQEQGNILYTGTPYQMDRGDRGNTKGYYIIDAKDNYKETFIENQVSPNYVKYDICELLDMNIKELTSLLSNNFVDVMIEINMSNKIPISQFLSVLEQVKYRKVEFFTYTSSDSSNEITTELSLDLSSSDKFDVFEIFKTYLNSKQYSQSIKKDLVTKFFEIQERAKNEKDYA
jgi:DNA repair exonuclease SbcCD nuclease subunit